MTNTSIADTHPAPQTVILWIMHFTPSLRLRASEEAEMLGIDDAEMGEFAYDYVGLEQEIGHTLEMNGGSEAQAGGREGDHLHHHRAEEKVLQEGIAPRLPPSSLQPSFPSSSLPTSHLFCCVI
ncbi:hypothetical protein C8J57DRAFT_1637658 [Mycena rebaudengoi]|nr:hypothetical protein C8J57DRAFT_1637658 [Mycena rebaudengoi]